jgi:hippurate hydrolase
MAAGARIELIFDGHAGHAALPHLTRDPMLAAGHAIVAAQSIIARSVDPLMGGVVSLTVIEGGEAQNQIPSRVTIKGTMRWLYDEAGDAIREGLQRITDGVAATCGVKGTLIISPGLGVTANSPAERDLAAAAAAAVTETRRDMRPAMTGEDFAWFLKEVPGAFVWIGNGPAEEGRDLHNARYDFNDAILPTASKFLTEVAKRALAGS